MEKYTVEELMVLNRHYGDELSRARRPSQQKKLAERIGEIVTEIDRLSSIEPSETDRIRAAAEHAYDATAHERRPTDADFSTFCQAQLKQACREGYELKSASDIPNIRP